MDGRIGVGLLVGLAISTSLFVYNTDKFTKPQKVFLLICIIFAPLQWLGIILLLIYNHYKKENTPERKRDKKVQKQTNSYDYKITSLKELKDNGILTEEEYNQKIKNLENLKLESQLKLSGDYKKLKSLFDDGILTKEEFEFKIDMLKNKLNTDINIDKTKLSKLSDKEIETITEIYTKTNNSSVIKQLRNKIETITNIELDLTDEKYIELIIKHREKHQ